MTLPSLLKFTPSPLHLSERTHSEGRLSHSPLGWFLLIPFSALASGDAVSEMSYTRAWRLLANLACTTISR